MPTHRLLPITPDNKFINNSLTPDYIEDRRFVRNAGRSSCTSLSPSEDRIRRTTQQKQEEVIKSGKSETDKKNTMTIVFPSHSFFYTKNFFLKAQLQNYHLDNYQALLDYKHKGIQFVIHHQGICIYLQQQQQQRHIPKIICSHFFHHLPKALNNQIHLSVLTLNVFFR